MWRRLCGSPIKSPMCIFQSICCTMKPPVTTVQKVTIRWSRIRNGSQENVFISHSLNVKEKSIVLSRGVARAINVRWNKRAHYRPSAPLQLSGHRSARRRRLVRGAFPVIQSRTRQSHAGSKRCIFIGSLAAVKETKEAAKSNG